MLTYRSALFIGILVVGCSAAVHHNPRPDPPSRDRTTVSVRNDNSSDVRIYLTRTTMRYALGTVPSMDERNFDIPSGALVPGSQLRLVADPVGLAMPHRTEVLMLRPGQTVLYRIKRELSTSYYTIAPG